MRKSGKGKIRTRELRSKLTMVHLCVIQKIREYNIIQFNCSAYNVKVELTGWHVLQINPVYHDAAWNAVGRINKKSSPKREQRSRGAVHGSLCDRSSRPTLSSTMPNKSHPWNYSTTRYIIARAALIRFCFVQFNSLKRVEARDRFIVSRRFPTFALTILISRKTKCVYGIRIGNARRCASSSMR